MATDTVPALTVRQPWAWAIIHGGKDVENRSWFTRHRGTLLIHAGSAFDGEGYELVQRLSSTPPPPPAELARMAIIGAVDLVDCVRDADSPWAEAGQWHWCLRGPRAFDHVVRCPGRLNLWRPGTDVMARLAYEWS